MISTKMKEIETVFLMKNFPHKCTCGHTVTLWDFDYIGPSKEFEWFTCKICKTSFVKKKERA